ncbi:MAG: hypothetical protein WCR27_08110 [Eubacteriales bacterium]
MGQKSINPDFKTTIYFGMKPLTEEEILNKLKSDRNIFLNFNRTEIIHSKDYSFITKVTFSEYDKNCVEGKKTEEEQAQAKKNLKVVEDYFNSQLPSSSFPYKLNFAERNDNECAIFNQNKYSTLAVQQKLEEIFG